jgi:hypothetical protein
MNTFKGKIMVCCMCQQINKRRNARCIWISYLLRDTRKRLYMGGGTLVCKGGEGGRGRNLRLEFE